MAATRKATGQKTGAKKPAGDTTKAKAKRVARKAKAAVGVAAHDAGLALRNTGHKVKRTAQKLETKLAAAKEPAKETAKRVGRKVTSALAGAGEAITSTGHRAKRSFDAAKKAFAETPTAPVRKRTAHCIPWRRRTSRTASVPPTCVGSGTPAFKSSPRVAA